jgi:hypothetical protein
VGEINSMLAYNTAIIRKKKYILKHIVFPKLIPCACDG